MSEEYVPDTEGDCILIKDPKTILTSFTLLASLNSHSPDSTPNYDLEYPQNVVASQVWTSNPEKLI
jgi:hypothetical protein